MSQNLATEKPAFKSIALVFGHSSGNLGDIAINQGQLRLVKNTFPSAKITVVMRQAASSLVNTMAEQSCQGIEDVEIRYFNFHQAALRAVDLLLSPERFLEETHTAGCDLVLISAGEHLFQYKHSTNDNILFLRVLPVLAAKAAGKACAILPSTYGPFETDKSVNLVNSLLNFADGYSFRDVKSSELVRSQLQVPEAPVLLDPAFFIEPGAGTVSQRADSKNLALMMRSENFGIRTSSEMQQLEQQHMAEGYSGNRALEFSLAFGDAYLKQNENHALSLFIQNPVEEVLSAQIARELAQAHGEKRVSVYRPDNLKDYLDSLSRCSAVVASRFHAIILGLVLDIPVVGVFFDSHGHKMPGLFKLLNQCRLCIDASTGPIVKKARRALSRLPKAEIQLPSIRALINQKQKQTMAWLKSLPRSQKSREDVVEFMRSLGPFAQQALAATVRRQALREKQTS